jgi:LmbE family N-acetylglucosaminyl deacetylase
MADRLSRTSSLASRYAGRTVVALGAHPDDVELALGGTLARLAQAGARVVIGVMSVPNDCDTRMAEARDSARLLGSEVELIMKPAGRRIDDARHFELVALADAFIKEYRPAAVFTHGPSEFHNDHVTVHDVVLATQRLGPFDLFCFSPTMCRPVAVPFHPRVYVDITKTMDVKMAAIAAHRSQFGGRGLDMEMYRELGRLYGRMAGVTYAEGLDVVRMLLC